MRGSLVYKLADSAILPFNVLDYGKELKNYADSISNLAKQQQEKMKTYGVSFEPLFSAINNFTDYGAGLHQRIKNVDLKKHVIFAPSSHNKYAGESFPGIYDALFDIENNADQQKAWEEVKRQIAIATFTVQAAGETLKDV
ncbi:hypothetical protein AB205_0189630 [Aquarana catesbeiana]|uniref:Transferrin receptor-like dimerisation domain-containing protein n=1 Tax=Aquarana catesbeiana TaxID=8400 RepID=A0A2G9RRI5_AQUCT|nr:hypothetical protein AB205_0189630 [Aquarana catesbeiana]